MMQVAYVVFRGFFAGRLITWSKFYTIYGLYSTNSFMAAFYGFSQAYGAKLRRGVSTEGHVT